MTRKNIRAILECNFSESKEELIDIAVKNIMALSQEPCTDAVSREEVIEIVNDIRDCISVDGYWAILERLKKLPSVNPQSCDDAISRDMALEKMAEYVASGYADSVEDFEEYSRIICQLPSVTQKSGKWILTIEDWNKWTCSNCGYVKRTDIHVNIGWKYCPNCGSAMKGE